jgi:hypothetical protein
MTHSLLTKLFAAGRLGGVASLLLGMSVIGYGYLGLGIHNMFLPVLALGLLLVILGGVVVTFGSPGTQAYYPKKPLRVSPMPREQFAANCALQSFPYTVCLTHSRVVDLSLWGRSGEKWENDVCTECNPLLDFLEIGGTEDLTLALANIDGSFDSTSQDR